MDDEGGEVRGRSPSFLAVRSAREVDAAPTAAETAQLERSPSLPSADKLKNALPDVKVVDLGACDFIKSVSLNPVLSSSPLSGGIGADPSKFGRPVRRGSIRSGDGAFQIDFLAPPPASSSTQGFTFERKFEPPAQKVDEDVAASAVVNKQVVGIVEKGAVVPQPEKPKGQLLQPREEETAAALPLRKRLVEVEDKTPSVVDKIKNHWLFHNKDAVSAEQEAAHPPHLSDGGGEAAGGEGGLSQRVIAALGIQAPSVTPRDSRKMNMWMPQGM